MPGKWETLTSQELFRTGFFTLRKERCRLPDGREMPGYYIVDFPDWIHIVALTANRDLILVRQYRHAAGLDNLEVPGGAMDRQRGETALAAAQRELREETGYESGDWLQLGVHYPNPALQSNRMVTFLARNCELRHPPKLDPYEDLTVELVPVDRIPAMIDAGEFSHSLILSSLLLARRYLMRENS